MAKGTELKYMTASCLQWAKKLDENGLKMKTQCEGKWGVKRIKHIAGSLAGQCGG